VTPDDVATSGGGPTAAPDPAPAAFPQAGRRGRRRLRRLVVVTAGLLVLAIVGFVGWYEAEAHPFGPEGAREIVSVAPGGSVTDTIGTLAGRGVVDSSLAFRISLFVHGAPTLLPGRYEFFRNEPFSAVRSTMAAGPDVFDVDVHPGNSLHEVEESVSEAVPDPVAAEFVEAVKGAAIHSPYDPPGSTDLEGLIGTGTYQVLPGESGSQLLGDMVDRFDHEARVAGLTAAAAARLGVTPYQLVTVASIDQKEGYFDRYLGKVARVIYNRLSAGMDLQMTSTVLYPIGQDGGPVTTADRALQSPYNTYLNSGLTPTPIGVPSLAALSAAVDPPAGPWLYFVVVDTSGTTLFATTYQQQLANEQIAKQNGVG
jgi:UPF0755 protein